MIWPDQENNCTVPGESDTTLRDGNMDVIGEVLVRVTIWFKFQENPGCLGMSALLSSRLEVFGIWDSDTSCQTWLDIRKYNRDKVPQIWARAEVQWFPKSFFMSQFCPWVGES